MQHMKKTAASLLAGLLILLSTSSHGEEWIYTFRPGDTLWDLCAKYVSASGCWKKIAERNRLANPKAIKPGTRLYLPLSWLKVKPAGAKLVSFSGKIQIISAEGVTLIPKTGMKLNAGDRILTGQGTALVRFVDGSELWLKPDSVSELSRLNQFGDTNIADTRIRLESGRAGAKVNKPPAGSSRYEISTPAAVAAARGTAYRVTSMGGQTPTMRTEVTAGNVAVASGDSEQQVAAGYAVAASSQGVSELFELLKAPTLKQESPARVSLFPWVLEWEALPGAHHYRVELIKEEGEPVLIKGVTVGLPAIKLTELETGRYTLHVRGVDKNGFEGFDATLQVLVSQPTTINPVILEGKKVGSGQKVRWSWNSASSLNRYRLQVTAQCHGKTHRQTHEVNATTWDTEHLGCQTVTAQVQPLLNGEPVSSSAQAEVVLEEPKGMWSIIGVAFLLLIMTL